MLKLSVFTSFFLLLVVPGFSQEITQNITGIIVDEETEERLPFVNVSIPESNPLIGTSTDEEGRFILKNVPLGRVNIEVSYIGYETLILPEILITSSKTVNLTIALKPMTTELSEIVIRPTTQKQKPVNRLATVSARMLSVEEASRYAGGFDDPARLAASFPGVASSMSNNAIVIRGNAPKFLQWKIEGVEIPNPNHFADLGAFGGGGLTALSSNLLANSDFFTGAFPAEYNNALSGVFDIRMRNGNSNHFEHSVELGLIGLDFASEGPLSKKNNSSYLFNYRYSTLGLVADLLPEDADGTNYQDLSFKLNFPSEKVGTFSLWGIGLIDNSGASPEADLKSRFYYQDVEKQKVRQYMGAMGLNHKIFLGNQTYFNSSMAVSTNGIDLTTDRINTQEVMLPHNNINNGNAAFVFKTYINKKISSQHINRTGLSWRGMSYQLALDQDLDGVGLLTKVVDQNGFTSLMSAFTNSTFSFQDWKLNLGLNTQYFSLNGNRTIEPRLGLEKRVSKNSQLSFGYGLHSRLEPLQIYFAYTHPSSKIQANRDLDFTKAHHFVLAYDWDITDRLHLKVEPYYQALFDVPIIEGGNSSLLNLQNDWFISDDFENSGRGRNYGLDLTFEQYLHKGFYFLVSGSLFKSAYRTADSEWFNTRFNKGFLFNGLVGKEFEFGAGKGKILGLNFRVSMQGGDRYSRVDEEASNLFKDVVYDETVPFTEKTTPSTFLHATISYQWNKPQSTQKLSLRLLNANNFKEFLGHRYNLRTGEVEEFREALFIPNFSYKLSF